MEIRIIGCGAMGSAIAKTLKENGQKISIYDKYPARCYDLAEQIHCKIATNSIEDLGEEDVLLLAVKPQDFDVTVSETKNFPGKLVVSILTGVSIEKLKKAYIGNYVLRMTPNLAVSYGDGIVALTEDESLFSIKSFIETLFSPLGITRWIPESLCDAVTALAGSGPAFVFALIEAMVEASISLGFSSEMGYEFVKQMVGGSMTTLYEAEKHPAELKWKVCSPSGTTIAGLRKFEEKNVRSGIIETFLAAYMRSQEFSKI